MNDQAFEAACNMATYNLYFWLAHAVGVSLILSFGVFGCYGLKKAWLSPLLLSISFCIVTGLTIMATGEKWKIRMSLATTERQRSAVAGRDGANLAVSPIIGCATGLIYCVTAMLLRKTCRCIKKSRTIKKVIGAKIGED